MLVRPGYESATSSSADRRSPDQALVEKLGTLLLIMESLTNWAKIYCQFNNSKTFMLLCFLKTPKKFSDLEFDGNISEK